MRSSTTAEIRQFVQERFPQFGLNKQKEIVRLLAEIDRRDHCGFDAILLERHYEQKDFLAIKSFLLKRRFPTLTATERASVTYLPCDFLKVQQPGPEAPGEGALFQPKNIYVEKSVSDCGLAERLSCAFPEARVSEIDRYKDFVSRQPEFDLREYNQRLDNVFIIREQFDFFQECPCSAGASSCGYHIMNAGFGCGYDCEYCFLQGYTNAPGILFPGNLDEFFSRFREYYRPGMRLGTGQFTDSLMFDHITRFSSELVGFFRQFPDVVFEFKTKSCNIEHLLRSPASPNIQVSWTLNPERIISSVEHKTASLQERLDAAVQCAKAGFRVGFHFDPIIIYDGWQKEYGELIKEVFNSISVEGIGWISLGGLRMTKTLRQVIEARFPHGLLLNAEQIMETDG
ncbi:MAG TPA: hypothetical protein P5160_07705, partial [Candidatus Omnitrophota bacterium]|nr:hypothetical protein [Candidatus Omnitrophota bacterium]